MSPPYIPAALAGERRSMLLAEAQGARRARQVRRQRPRRGTSVRLAQADRLGTSKGHPRHAPGRERPRFARSGNGRADCPVWPAGSQKTSASAGLAAVPCQEPAAAPRAEVIPPGNPGHDQAPRPVSRSC